MTDTKEAAAAEYRRIQAGQMIDKFNRINRAVAAAEAADLIVTWDRDLEGEAAEHREAFTRICCQLVDLPYGSYCTLDAVRIAAIKLRA